MLENDMPGTRECSMAKLFVSEVCAKVTRMGVQIMGAYGQTSDYDMERYFRDSIMATVGGGSSQIQRSIIAKKMGL